MYKIKRGIYEFEESLVKGFYKAKVDNYLYFGSGNCDSSFHCQYSSLAGQPPFLPGNMYYDYP
jgi:hypothetical protein